MMIFLSQSLSSSSLSAPEIVPRDSDCGDGTISTFLLGNGGLDVAGLGHAGFYEPAVLGSVSGNAGFDINLFDGDGSSGAFYDEGLGCDDAILGNLKLTTGWGAVPKLTLAEVQVLNTSMLSM